MRKPARYLYIGTAWLTLAWILVTIFTAGIALFVRTPYWDMHKEVGWGSGLALLILIAVGLVGWIPRRLAGWLIALIVLHTLHTLLPAMKTDLPLAAAIHPLSATLLAWLSLMHARRAQAMLLQRPENPAAPVSEQHRAAPAESG